MATLRAIRQRITAVRNTSKITSAMKMVAAAKLKRAQNAIESARPYFIKLEGVVANLLGALGSEYSNVLMRTADDVKNIGVIIIGSDKGLCGGFNSGLFKYVNAFLHDDIAVNYPNANVKLISVGNKAVGFFKKQKLEVIAEYPGVFTGLNFASAQDIVQTVALDFYAGKFDKVYLCYNQFINIARQIPSAKQLLPLEPKLNAGEKKENVEYIFEPEKSEILDALLPKVVDMNVWRSLLESNAAEQGAKMMAMDKATTNANELVGVLELQYNNARQAAITTEMLEIVSGANAQRG